MAAVMDPAYAISTVLSYRMVPMRTMGPDVIILEHDHAREVVPVRVDPADEHRVLLHEPEAGRRLARARNDAAVPARAREVFHAARPTEPPSVPN